MVNERRPIRWYFAKALKLSQRMIVRCTFGVALFIAADWVADEAKRDMMRSSGLAIAAWAYLSWDSKQGRRKINPVTGQQTRTPTMQISRDDVDRALQRRSESE